MRICLSREISIAAIVDDDGDDCTCVVWVSGMQAFLYSGPCK